MKNETVAESKSDDDQYGQALKVDELEIITLIYKYFLKFLHCSKKYTIKHEGASITFQTSQSKNLTSLPQPHFPISKAFLSSSFATVLIVHSQSSSCFPSS